MLQESAIVPECPDVIVQHRETERKKLLMDSLLAMPDYKLVLEVSVNGMCSRSRWCF